MYSVKLQDLYSIVTNINLHTYVEPLHILLSKGVQSLNQIHHAIFN